MLTSTTAIWKCWAVDGGEPDKESVNDGWRNDGFQAYADYINTPDVQKIINELAELSEDTKYAMMCAEAVYWRCHRRLLADALVVRNIPVYHILGPDQLMEHSLNDMGKVLEDGRVVYPSKQQKLFGN